MTIEWTKKKALKEIEAMYKLVQLEFQRYNPKSLPLVNREHKAFMKWLEEKIVE